MSTICCVKDPEVLYLGTDSRCVIGSTPINDAQPKIFKVADGVFLAASGRQSAIDFQVKRAMETAAELDTTDVRLIATALQRDTMPFLEGLAARLRMEANPDPMTRAHLDGRALLHGCVICGTSQAALGYVDQSYVIDGRGLACMAQEHFLAGREVTATTGGTLELLNSTLSRCAAEPGFWTDPAEAIASRLLTTLKDASEVSGGPNQVLRLDRNGAEWVCAPPAVSPMPVELSARAQSTVTALVSMISPSISGGSISGGSILGGSIVGGSISGGSIVGTSFTCINGTNSITIDPANFLKILNPSTGFQMLLNWLQLSVSDTHGYVSNVSPYGFSNTYGAGGRQVSISNGIMVDGSAGLDTSVQVVTPIGNRTLVYKAGVLVQVTL